MSVARRLSLPRHGVTIGRAALLLLILATSAGCETSPRPRLSELPTEARQSIWAEYIARRSREADLRGTPAHALAAQQLDSFLEHLSRNYAYGEDDLAQLIEAGERNRWAESSRCQIREGPIRQHALIVAPLPIEPPKAEYTSAACTQGIQGIVILEATIDAAGRVAEATVLRGLPHGLDAAAERAVLRSRWAPALLCGRPVAVVYNISVPYRLPCAAGNS